ncbi:MAG: PKD domain-containing protein [Kiritimatiellales bacterium]|nr:PKD domain-containing protein [Kiritimatiellales bacterium]
MPDTPPSVDSLSHKPAQANLAGENVPPKLKNRMKTIIIILVGVPYLCFVAWALFLISVFPNRTGAFQNLLVPGIISSGAVAVIFVIVGLFVLKRIFRKGIPVKFRIFGALRLVAFIAPGLILCALIPNLITREPSLGIAITDPTDIKDLVAPLPITFNLDNAVEILQRRGLSVNNYSWDFDGDNEENESTPAPYATAIFERPGSYDVTVTLSLSDNSYRKVSRRVTIQTAVFSYSPMRPGVEEPIKFSVSHLVDNPKEDIKEVQWDFDGDGIIDETTMQPDTVHAYLRTGKVTVSATLKLSNQTQNVYRKEIEIFDPQPPPFPVKIVTEPEYLVSPAPFGTIFRIETDEPIDDVIWDFGDGEKKKGERIGHTFQQRGVFQVSVRVYAESGELAQLSEVVRVVDTLKLPDLSFEGMPDVINNKIQGEVPVTVNLTPRTSVPLIDFSWEAPGATSVGSTDVDLQAIYRRDGRYDITLIAQDPDGKVLRHKLDLIVDPPSSFVAIHMSPEGGVAPVLVRFDASETVIPGEEISGFEWVFGDSIDAPQQRGALVEHLFEQPGTFTVELRAYTTSGNMYSEDKTIVIRAPVLDACAYPSRTSGLVPFGVSFNMDCTTGIPSSILWNFGDGAESDERNPVHVFEEAGIYNITLTIRDDVGTTSSEVIIITAE